MYSQFPLVFDCSNTFGIDGCDVDSGLALLYLLGSPEVELLGVTCSYGSSTQETVYQNTCRLLKEWGREDIPVFRGAENAKERSSEAAKFLADTAKKYAGRLRVLATGVMTNLLGAAQIDPAFFENVEAFSLMGGVTDRLFMGNLPQEEWIFSRDSEAAYAVLSQGKQIQLATAQSCLSSYFATEQYGKVLAESDKPIARYLEKALAPWLDHCKQAWDMDGYINWSVTAAVQLVVPSYFVNDVCYITPTEETLQTGELFGYGRPVRILIPQVTDADIYCEHIYGRLLAANVTPSLD